MKTYIKNISGLNELLGYDEPNEFDGEDIGYGEKAIVFEDVTDLCEGLNEDERLVDFIANADFGKSFIYHGKILCKVRRPNDDAEIVYEDEDGELRLL